MYFMILYGEPGKARALFGDPALQKVLDQTRTRFPRATIVHRGGFTYSVVQDGREIGHINMATC